MTKRSPEDWYWHDVLGSASTQAREYLSPKANNLKYETVDGRTRPRKQTEATKLSLEAIRMWCDWIEFALLTTDRPGVDRDLRYKAREIIYRAMGRDRPGDPETLVWEYLVEVPLQTMVLAEHLSMTLMWSVDGYLMRFNPEKGFWDHDWHPALAGLSYSDLTRSDRWFRATAREEWAVRNKLWWDDQKYNMSLASIDEDYDDAPWLQFQDPAVTEETITARKRWLLKEFS